MRLRRKVNFYVKLRYNNFNKLEVIRTLIDFGDLKVEMSFTL